MAETNNFTIWAQNVLPIVFDDYVSQKDLFVKMVRYINGLIGDAVTLYNDYTAMETGTIGDLEDLHTTEKGSVVGAINEVKYDVEALKTDKLDAPALAGTSGQVLTSDGEGGQVWAAVGTGEIVVDNTLTVSGAAADAKVTGDEIGALKEDITKYDDGLTPFYPNALAWYRGYFDSTGAFVSTNTNAAPTNTPFAVSAGSKLLIKPNGLSVGVRVFTKSGNTYTQESISYYTTDTTLTFANARHIALWVNKINGSSLELSEVTTKLYFYTKTEKRFENIESDVDSIETKIGSTPMGTTATTITGAIAEHETEIDEIKSDVVMSGYEEGLPVTIQRVSNAVNFKLNEPSGRMLVKATDAPIFTGTQNNIDLLNIKQGTFTDPTSGVTIEVTGNEVYIHGTTTAGFRYDFQTGQFYTDSFSNHPADLDILPSVANGYKLCFYPKTGYTMPTNIFVGALNKAGTTINAINLSGNSNEIYKNGTYIALYSNAAITGINIKFTLGFKISDIPGTIAGIQAVAQMEYATTVITSPGAYVLGRMTWTGDSTTYTANTLLKSNPSTEGHVFAWFGDSISQLRELPNIVSKLIGATVYDCSFAGAPLTYGDPTKYQPTGFMSLCSQIVAGDFSDLSDALDAQEAAGINVTEKRQHLATLQALDFDNVTDIVLLAGTNDFDNDYVNATNFVSGFSSAVTALLTAYPQLIIHVLSPIWRGDKSQGVVTIPTMPDLVDLEKTVANNFNLPFCDLYRTSGINSLTASAFLENDLLHLSAAGDTMVANKCAKVLLSN